MVLTITRDLNCGTDSRLKIWCCDSCKYLKICQFLYPNHTLCNDMQGDKRLCFAASSKKAGPLMSTDETQMPFSVGRRMTQLLQMSLSMPWALSFFFPWNSQPEKGRGVEWLLGGLLDHPPVRLLPFPCCNPCPIIFPPQMIWSDQLERGRWMAKDEASLKMSRNMAKRQDGRHINCVGQGVSWGEFGTHTPVPNLELTYQRGLGQAREEEKDCNPIHTFLVVIPIEYSGSHFWVHSKHPEYSGSYSFPCIRLCR